MSKSVRELTPEELEQVSGGQTLQVLLNALKAIADAKGEVAAQIARYTRG